MRGGEGEGAAEQGLVLCLEVIPKASHHIQLDKGIGEISVCACACVCVFLSPCVCLRSACVYIVCSVYPNVCL